MVIDQIQRRGIKDKRVLKAMRTVPRHLFVDKQYRSLAYEDGPLTIGYGQTISQPFMVAYMTERLHLLAHHSVLEVGTGCGYQAAVLSMLAQQVISLERIPELAQSAKTRLPLLGYTNISIIQTNGWKGYREESPYDRIIVTAAADKLPTALVKQLAVGGVMIIPIGKRLFNQKLHIISKDDSGNVIEETSFSVRFVQLVNK